jgi:L-ascorbate metabolism protein UlaG (beta-lactamase superfamily)
MTEDVAKIQGPETVIVTSQSCLKKLTSNVQIVAPCYFLTVKGIQVQVVPASAINKKFQPKKKAWLGFIIQVDGVLGYHAGDTDLIPEMRKIQADITLLPVSGTSIMTAEEAAEAALTIKAGPGHPDALPHPGRRTCRCRTIQPPSQRENSGKHS